MPAGETLAERRAGGRRSPEASVEWRRRFLADGEEFRTVVASRPRSSYFCSSTLSSAGPLSTLAGSYLIVRRAAIRIHRDTCARSSKVTASSGLAWHSVLLPVKPQDRRKIAHVHTGG